MTKTSRRLAARMPTWAVIAALAFQTLTPFAQAMPSFDADEPLIICTQFGLSTVNPGETPRGDERPSSDRSHCAVCISLDSARSLSSSPRLAELAFTAWQSITYFPIAARLAATSGNARIWPRPPPHLT